MPDKIYLRQMQGLPLIVKVRKTQLRIKEWYEHFDGNVYVSFGGGKDSTVLAHLVHELYPEVPLVFANTGLEYPEIQSFARKMGAEFVRPKMMFSGHRALSRVPCRFCTRGGMQSAHEKTGRQQQPSHH